MNAFRLVLLFLGVCALVLTLVWLIMWLVGVMSGLLPLFAFVGFMACGVTLLGTFADKDSD